MKKSLGKSLFCYAMISLSASFLSSCALISENLSALFPNGKFASLYASQTDQGFQLPAIPYYQIQSRYLRQRVPNITNQPPRVIVVDTHNHFLYYTEPGGTAMRYGIGVGRDGFRWAGEGVIRAKRAWPTWTPTPEMVKRDPSLHGKSETFKPGLMNPLGARALYIYNNQGQDTLYRIHGSPEWWSIGQNVSSGCIRLINQDIIDLYNRVPYGTRVIVM